MQRQRPGFATRSARPLVLWCLMLVLPVYGWSATLAELLGALHWHTASAVRVVAADPLAGWQDFRRAVHGSPGVTAAPSHQHDVLARHHHTTDDASVAALEPVNAADAAAGAEGQPASGAAAVFAFDRHAIGMAAPAREQRWLAAREVVPASLAAARLERPPKA